MCRWGGGAGSLCSEVEVEQVWAYLKGGGGCTGTSLSRQTDMTEKITFPQLRWQAVIRDNGCIYTSVETKCCDCVDEGDSFILKNRNSSKMGFVPIYTIEIVMISIHSSENNDNRPHNRNRDSWTNRRCKWTLCSEAVMFQYGISNDLSFPTAVVNCIRKIKKRMHFSRMRTARLEAIWADVTVGGVGWGLGP